MPFIADRLHLDEAQLRQLGHVPRHRTRVAMGRHGEISDGMLPFAGDTQQLEALRGELAQRIFKLKTG